MFYVYVLKSKKDGKHYIGVTDNLVRRFREHNNGLNISTKYRKPFVLIYYEAYRREEDAMLREKRLKQFKNGQKELLKRLIFSDNV